MLSPSQGQMGALWKFHQPPYGDLLTASRPLLPGRSRNVSGARNQPRDTHSALASFSLVSQEFPKSGISRPRESALPDSPAEEPSCQQ